MLDYIFIKRKWAKSVKNCNVKKIQSFKSDHKLLILTLKWTFGNNKKKSPQIKLDYDLFRGEIVDDDTKAKKTLLAILEDISINYTFDSIKSVLNYTNFTNALKIALEKSLPKLESYAKSKPWLDGNIIALRKKYLAACLVHQSVPSNTNKVICHQLKEDLKSLYYTQEEQYYNDRCHQIKEAQNERRSKLAWDLINSLSGRKNKRTDIISAEDKDNRLNLWFEHFKSLLSPAVKPQRTDLNLNKSMIIEKIYFISNHNQLSFIIEFVSSTKSKIQARRHSTSKFRQKNKADLPPRGFIYHGHQYVNKAQ